MRIARYVPDDSAAAEFSHRSRRFCHADGPEFFAGHPRRRPATIALLLLRLFWIDQPHRSAVERLIWDSA